MWYLQSCEHVKACPVEQCALGMVQVHKRLGLKNLDFSVKTTTEEVSMCIQV